MYSAVVQCTTGAAANVVGVAPVTVASGDYFWLQTWGPAAMKTGAGATGEVAADVTGQCIAYTSAAAQAAMPGVGIAMMDIVASENGLVFVTLAP
jgi:hypothetical protein